LTDDVIRFFRLFHNTHPAFTLSFALFLSQLPLSQLFVPVSSLSPSLSTSNETAIFVGDLFGLTDDVPNLAAGGTLNYGPPPSLRPNPHKKKEPLSSTLWSSEDYPNPQNASDKQIPISFFSLLSPSLRAVRYPPVL